MKRKDRYFWLGISRVMRYGKTEPAARGKEGHQRSDPPKGDKGAGKRKLKTPADDEEPLDELGLDPKEFEFDSKEDGGLPGDLRLVEPEDFVKSVLQIKDEAVRSHKRRELHGEKMLQLAQSMEKLHKAYLKQQAVIGELKAKPRSLGGASDLNFDGLMHRMRVPKRFAKDPFYYLTTALDPQRVGYASMFEGVGEQSMTPQMRAIARRSLLNDATQARVYECQALNDISIITDAVLAQDKDSDYAATPRIARMQKLRCVREWKRAYKSLRDAAMDTLTAGEGLEWVIPTIMSSQLHTIVMANLVLADQFDWPTMPGPSWKDPVEGADPVAYMADQALEDPADAAAKPLASVIGTRNFQLDAIKAMARVVLADEVEEDLVIPAVPRILFQLGRAHARFREIALVNGFRSALAGFDTADVPPSRDARLAWNGLRWFQKNVQAGLAGGQTLEVDLATLSATALANMLGVQKEYGQNTDEGFFLTGYSGWIRFLTLYDTANGTPIVLTLEKMGAAATLFRGQLGQVFGRPIIVSQYIREDLNASGIYDNVTKTKTVVLHVNRRGFKGGERRSLRIQRGDELKMETGQITLVSSWRGAWAPVNYAGQQLYVSLGKNLPSY